MNPKFLAWIAVGVAGGCGFLGHTPAFAGPVVIEEVVVETPSHNLIDPITGSVSAGYDSLYIFRGTNLGKNAPWAEIDLSVPLGNLTLDVGAWYINPINGNGSNPLGLDELDLYASLGLSLGIFDVWVGYTAYIYPEGGSGSTNEVGAGVRANLGDFYLGVAAYYDFDVFSGTWYLYANGGYTLSLTDWLALSLGAGIGYQSNNPSGSSDFTHVDVIASLPVDLTETATLEPFIAAMFPLDGRPFQVNELYGGVSLSVRF